MLIGIFSIIGNYSRQDEVPNCFPHAWRDIIQFVRELFLVLKYKEASLLIIFNWNDCTSIWTFHPVRGSFFVPTVCVTISEDFICSNIVLRSRQNR